VQKQVVEEEFIDLYSSWVSPAWDELDWSKVKDLQVRELLVEREKMATIVQNAESLNCPNFVKHVSIIHL
jgi:antiviral helicase SKI2